MPDKIIEVAIVSILDIDLDNNNTKPLTITGTINKLRINGYME